MFVNRTRRQRLKQPHRFRFLSSASVTLHDGGSDVDQVLAFDEVVVAPTVGSLIIDVCNLGPPDAPQTTLIGKLRLPLAELPTEPQSFPLLSGSLTFFAQLTPTEESPAEASTSAPNHSTCTALNPYLARTDCAIEGKPIKRASPGRQLDSHRLAGERAGVQTRKHSCKLVFASRQLRSREHFNWWWWRWWRCGGLRREWRWSPWRSWP